MRNWSTRLPVVLAAAVAMMGCKDKKTTACSEVLVEVAEAEVNIQKTRQDEDSKLADIGKTISAESKDIKAHAVKDEKLSDLKDKYADTLEEYAEVYKDKDSSLKEFSKGVSKTNKKRFSIIEGVVGYCKPPKSE